MKPGQMVESAIWLSGEETEQMIQAWKDRVRENTDQTAKNFNVEVGPFTWVIKYPGDDRVPPVPDHIKGIDVKLLVGEASVIAKKTVIHKQSGFVYELTNEDRKLLHRITRKAFAKRQPGSKLSDQHCDAVIEQLGPEAALKTLRRGSFDA
jgi:hypothetical protein